MNEEDLDFKLPIEPSSSSEKDQNSSREQDGVDAAGSLIAATADQSNNFQFVPLYNKDPAKLSKILSSEFAHKDARAGLFALIFSSCSAILDGF